jgi:hypothetical protein
VLNLHQIRAAAAEFAATRFGKVLLGVAGIAIVVAAASQYRADTYPTDWPALAAAGRNSTSAPNCPDLSGTYALHASKDTCCGFDQHSTFLADDLVADPAMPWRTVTISGATGRGLTLTFEREAGSENAAPRKLVTVLPYGARYRCEAGWVVGQAVPVFLYPAKADAHQSTRRRAGTLPSHFRKDISGALVARADVRETLKFSPSIASAFSIPYASYIAPKWARWSPSSPPSPVAPVNVKPDDTRAMDGDSAVAAAESIARSHLREGALPGPLVKNGDIYVFTFYGERDAAIAATLRALQADPTVTAVTLNSSVKNSVGLFEATIGFRLAAGSTPN